MTAARVEARSSRNFRATASGKAATAWRRCQLSTASSTVPGSLEAQPLPTGRACVRAVVPAPQPLLGNPAPGEVGIPRQTQADTVALNGAAGQLCPSHVRASL